MASATKEHRPRQVDDDNDVAAVPPSNDSDKKQQNDTSSPIIVGVEGDLINSIVTSSTQTPLVPDVSSAGEVLGAAAYALGAGSEFIKMTKAKEAASAEFVMAGGLFVAKGTECIGHVGQALHVTSATTNTALGLAGGPIVIADGVRYLILNGREWSKCDAQLEAKEQELKRAIAVLNGDHIIDNARAAGDGGGGAGGDDEVALASVDVITHEIKLIQDKRYEAKLDTLGVGGAKVIAGGLLAGACVVAAAPAVILAMKVGGFVMLGSSVAVGLRNTFRPWFGYDAAKKEE